jgi:subtilisin-like proprotein convertase family protein
MKYKIVVRLALILSFWVAPVHSKADSFVGTGGGNIPDDSPTDPTDPTDNRYGTPLVVNFTVSNLQASVQSVSLTISMYHQALGDLDVQLRSPTGTNFIIFSRVGPYNAGYGNLDILGTTNTTGGYNFGTYTFADSATNTLRSWTEINYGASNPGGDPYPIPGGSYRTSSAGPSNDVATSFATNSRFIGLSPAQANGTWTLTFRDRVAGSFGAVQSATLVLGQVSSQPVRFTRIVVTNHFVTLNLSGPNSQGFTLYTTTNLAPPQHWTTNGGGTFDGSGKATFSTNSAGPLRFYRVSSP